MFYTLEMSRRARVIVLWAIMEYLGTESIDNMILTFHQRVKHFSNKIREVRGFYVDSDIVFNQVIFRCNNDKITARVLSNIQNIREYWLGG